MIVCEQVDLGFDKCWWTFEIFCNYTLERENRHNRLLIKCLSRVLLFAWQSSRFLNVSQIIKKIPVTCNQFRNENTMLNSIFLIRICFLIDVNSDSFSSKESKIKMNNIGEY